MTDPFLADVPDLAASLARATILGDNETQTSQIQHRLNILKAWFGDLHSAREALKDHRILECGCGQGDTTIALAHMVSTGSRNEGRVFAVDPAPLDYGAPFTLGQAQKHISQSNFGPWIQWVQKDPVDYIRILPPSECPDVVVLCHAVFYLESEGYLVQLLRALHQMAMDRKLKRVVRLCVAEWGMREENREGGDESRAHVLAVELQGSYPWEEGNVQSVIRPERLVELAQSAGWVVEREEWIERPGVEDGKWEVGNVKMLIERGKLGEEAKGKLEEMEELSKDGKEVRSMDVFTCVFSSS